MRLLLARTRARAECAAGALDEVLLHGPAHCYHAGLFSDHIERRPKPQCSTGYWYSPTRGTGPIASQRCLQSQHTGGHHVAYSCIHGRARVGRGAGAAGGRAIGRRSRKAGRRGARRRRRGQRAPRPPSSRARPSIGSPGSRTRPPARRNSSATRPIPRPSTTPTARCASTGTAT